MDRSRLSRFFGGLLPHFQQFADVQVADTFQSKFLLEPLQAEFYLDYFGDGMEARPVFHYGEASFNPILRKEPKAPKGRIVVRDKALENEFMDYFSRYGFQPEHGRLVQPAEEKSYDFLTEALPALTEKADIFYADSFEKKPVRKMPKVTAGVSVNDSNLLEVTFSARDIDFDELMDILSDYRQKRRYHRMEDGTFMTLEDQQLSALADLSNLSLLFNIIICV